jgi:hypothetical protein
LRQQLPPFVHAAFLLGQLSNPPGKCMRLRPAYGDSSCDPTADLYKSPPRSYFRRSETGMSVEGFSFIGATRKNGQLIRI